MTKIKIFISSKSSPIFEGLDVEDYNLSMLRRYLKETIENEDFLGEKIFNVMIHEVGFAADFTSDAFEVCLKKMSESDIVIILYNGDAGWVSLDANRANGICYEEFLTASKEHPSMTFGINISRYFENVQYNDEETTRNSGFRTAIDNFYPFMESPEANNVEDLQNEVLGIIKSYIIKSLEYAFKAKKELDASNTIFGETLNWSKLTYQERVDKLNNLSINHFENFAPFNEIILKQGVIPDNMSVTDARNYIKRPFLYEQNEIKKSKLEKGVIHIVTVYGNATETQVKNLVGHPDLTVIKTPFGLYLWEQGTHIQMFFLTNCINPNTVGTRVEQLRYWLNRSGELKKVQQRSHARFLILDAINKSQRVEDIH